MIDNWLDFCMDLAQTPADFYAGGNRKIIRNRSVTFDTIADDLHMPDAGYTKSKQTMLRRLYLHEESLSMAVSLWDRRVKQDKYGSVGFTTYNHLLKTDPDRAAKRTSVMGPCIQSLTLTYMNDRTCQVDAFYRTTEVFKKFPADLVFIRDDLLSRFDFSNSPLTTITFHFANITCHPMYFITLVPLLADPIAEFELIRKHDFRFFEWVIKGTARYLIPKYHRGIEKFAQAMRVSSDANARIDDKMKKQLVAYLEQHHPGFRKDYPQQFDM